MTPLNELLKRGPPSRSAQERGIFVPVYDNFTLTTNGTGTYSYIEFPAEVQQLIETWGPWTNSITAHTQTLQRTTNHDWLVGFYKSFDGKIWSANPVTLFTGIVATGAPVETAYSTVTDFTAHMRWVTGCKNDSGTALESAMIGLGLMFDFRT